MSIKRAAGDQNTRHAFKVLDPGYLPALLRDDEPRVRLNAQWWVVIVARLDKVTMQYLSIVALLGHIIRVRLVYLQDDHLY